RNGTIYKYPQGATGPTGHNLNFSAADFTLEGSTADSATPALVSFAVGPKTVTPGQDVSIDYAVSDDSDEITYVYFTFADAIGNTRSLGVDNPSGIPLNGT
ncbi:hypothetical protein ACT8ZV_12125, partial [Nocardioides sp. MAHUQ-72]|uniref:hypothetical protein n=1 Tax=unclassified Nocardioides TaxID=2615069 RepID=UPI0036102FA1